MSKLQPLPSKQGCSLPSRRIGFGGKGKYCLYDTNGKERNDARGRTIHSIGGELTPIEADGPYPVMADIEMFDLPSDNDMKTSWGFDLTTQPRE